MVPPSLISLLPDTNSLIRLTARHRYPLIQEAAQSQFRFKGQLRSEFQTALFSKDALSLRHLLPVKKYCLLISIIAFQRIEVIICKFQKERKSSYKLGPLVMMKPPCLFLHNILKTYGRYVSVKILLSMMLSKAVFLEQ